MRNARHQADPRPIDEHCGCIACRGHSRAYVHHLFRAEEMLGPILLTAHNMYYYQELMRGLRQAIEEKRLEAFAASFAAEQAQGDIEALE
jgi:queuine tRNA-ribosyltransferase